MTSFRVAFAALWILQVGGTSLAQERVQDEVTQDPNEGPLATDDEEAPLAPDVARSGEASLDAPSDAAPSDAAPSDDAADAQALPAEHFESLVQPSSTELAFQLRADRPGRVRFVAADGEALEFRAPGRASLEPLAYAVSWLPAEGTAELLEAGWRPSGAPLRIAHRGPSFTNLLGYWLLGNGLLVGLPVSVGVFAKRGDLGSAATFSIIGVNTLVAIVGAVLMGVGDDEVIELEAN